jgi:hypothetical protein
MDWFQASGTTMSDQLLQRPHTCIAWGLGVCLDRWVSSSLQMNLLDILRSFHALMIPHVSTRSMHTMLTNSGGKKGTTMISVAVAVVAIEFAVYNKKRSRVRPDSQFIYVGGAPSSGKAANGKTSRAFHSLVLFIEMCDRRRWLRSLYCVLCIGGNSLEDISDRCRPCAGVVDFADETVRLRCVT